ncbi:hypothetical protein Tco_0993188 [Tanacetum coccineum]|uniref:Uncharacterized protein n=1 Tax=Tanacetum coccineum TaxID=301880 RepID=A0ABQ5F532_9ASTR
MVLGNDGVFSKSTKERVKSLSLKAKVTRGQTSYNSVCQVGSDEDEYEELNFMAGNFRKFFRKGNKFVRNNHFSNGGNRFEKSQGDGNKGEGNSKKEHECYKLSRAGFPRNKEFVDGACSNSEDIDQPNKEATFLMEINSQEPKSSPLIEDGEINDQIVKDLNRSLLLEANVLEPGHPNRVKEARGHLIKQLIDFQDSPNNEKDTRSSQEYLNDLIEEYQERALLAKSKRSFKMGSQSPSQQKPELRPNKDFEVKYNKIKAKLALLSSGTSSKSSMVKNKGLIVEAYEWDEEDVSSNDNDMTEVKVLKALADDENVIVGKEIARNGEWVKISTRKVHTLLDMEDNDDRKSFLDYLCIDLNYVEEQRNNLVLKHRDLVQELKTCKE